MQTPDIGASASIPEPWDDITGNKVIITAIPASRVSPTGFFEGTARGSRVDDLKKIII